MPTVEWVGPYRFFFYSNEGDEPPHIHVRRERALAKFWLQPIVIAGATHFAAHELRIIARLVAEKREQFLEAWHEHFGD
jgi:hypothetical protein